MAGIFRRSRPRQFVSCLGVDTWPAKERGGREWVIRDRGVATGDYGSKERGGVVENSGERSGAGKEKSVKDGGERQEEGKVMRKKEGREKDRVVSLLITTNEPPSHFCRKGQGVFGPRESRILLERSNRFLWLAKVHEQTKDEQGCAPDGFFAVRICARYVVTTTHLSF